MADSQKQKRPRTNPARVADMTTDELQVMLEALIDRKMSEWIGDPDAGLELRSEMVVSIEHQRRENATGNRGKSLDEVAQRLGLD